MIVIKSESREREREKNSLFYGCTRWYLTNSEGHLGGQKKSNICTFVFYFKINEMKWNALDDVDADQYLLKNTHTHTFNKKWSESNW